MTSETILVYGEAPPDCRQTHGSGWDNTYDGGGTWAGCECTFGCSSGPTNDEPSGGGDDGAGTGGGGGGGGGVGSAQSYYATKDCLRSCDGYKFDWFDDCMDNGFFQQLYYCPIPRGAGEACPGVEDICRTYLLNPDGTHIASSCMGSRAPSCVRAFATCEYGWQQGLSRFAEAFRASCRKVVSSRVTTCQWSCMRDLGRGLLCDYSDSSILVDNGRIDAGGWCTKDGRINNCVTPGHDGGCQLGPEALD